MRQRQALVAAAPGMPPFRAMSTKRRSYEAGHKRKYLVVIDDTEECDRAVYWAAKRAGRTKSQLVMLRVIETGERNQQWLGVADIMKAEATGSGQRGARQIRRARQGHRQHHARPRDPRRRPAEEIVKLIDEDADIGILVLAAGTAKEGPGPLVSQPGQDRRHVSDSGRDRAGPSERRRHRRQFVINRVYSRG